MISSTTDGTWCCQQPAPQKFRKSTDEVFLSSSPWTCLRRARSLRIAGGMSSVPLKRRRSGISAKISSTLLSPSSSSMACLVAGTELGMYGWMNGLSAIVRRALLPLGLYGVPAVTASPVVWGQHLRVRSLAHDRQS